MSESQTTGSANNAILGISGSGAVAFGGPFLAYINNTAGEAYWRMVIIFESRTIADEWWRAVSTSQFSYVKDSVKRLAPQFYTHNVSVWNMYNFFDDGRITSLSAPFKGRMFLQLQNDRGGRGIDIIPRLPIVDYASGGWFSIRSKSDAANYWYYEERSQCIIASSSYRSLFRIVASNVPASTIMVGSDDVTLLVQYHGYIVPKSYAGPSKIPSGAQVLGVSTAQSDAFEFKFENFDKGRYVPGLDKYPTPICYMPQGGASPGWELVL